MKKTPKFRIPTLKLTIEEPPIAMTPQTNISPKELNEKNLKNYSSIESEVSKIFSNKLKELKTEEKSIEAQNTNLNNLKEEYNKELKNNNHINNLMLESEKELEKFQNKFSKISKQKYKNLALLSKKFNILNFKTKNFNPNLNKILLLISENSIEQKINFWECLNSNQIEMVEFLIYLDQYFASLEKQDIKKFNTIKNIINDIITNDNIPYPYNIFLNYLYNIVQCIILNITINEIKMKIKLIESEKSISFIKLSNIESSFKETENKLKDKKNYKKILLEVINQFLSIKKRHEQNLINNNMYISYLLNIQDSDLSEKKYDINKNNNINISNASTNKTIINSSDKKNDIKTNEFLLAAVPYFKKSKIALYNNKKNFKFKESRNNTNKKISMRKIKSNITSNNNSINSFDPLKNYRSYNSVTNCRKFSNDYLFILEGPINKKINNDNININKEVENNGKIEIKKNIEKRKKKIIENNDSNQNLESSISSYNINESSQNSTISEILNKKKKKIGIIPMPFSHKINNISLLNDNNSNKNNKLSNEKEIQLFNKKTGKINFLKKQKIKEIFNHSMIPKPSKKKCEEGNIICFLKNMNEKNSVGKSNSSCIKVKYSIFKKLHQNNDTNIKNCRNSYDNKRFLNSEKTVEKPKMKNIKNLISKYSSESIFNNRSIISRNCSPKTINKVGEKIKKINENKNSFCANKNNSINHYNSSNGCDDSISSKKKGMESFSLGRKEILRRNFHDDINKNYRNSGCFNSCT